jgi:hypothetical protein
MGILRGQNDPPAERGEAPRVLAFLQGGLVKKGLKERERPLDM